MVVVFDHFCRFWLETPVPPWLGRTLHFPLLRVFNDGAAAVMLFFLLSGFVLALPYLRGRETSYRVYALRRICRIYPPYFAALILAITACWKFHNFNGYGKEFHSIWAGKPDLLSILQHVLLIDRFDVLRYNPPSWSLVHEMRISLFFPLLAWVGVKLRTRYAVGISLLLPALATAASHIWPHPNVVLGVQLTEYTATVGFSGIFLIGILIARHKEWLGHIFHSLPVWGHVLLFLIAAKLYLYPPHIPSELSAYFQSFGAAYLIVAALSSRGYFVRFLRTTPLQFLGRVSYSIYLVHTPVLMMLSILCYKRMPYGYLLLPYVALSLGVATLFYEAVEKPSIELGRALGKRLSQGEHAPQPKALALDQQ